MKNINQILKIEKNYNAKIILFFIALSLFSKITFSQQTDICQQSLMIVKTAEKYHFKPKTLNDEFSELVFSEFISFVDPYGLYFTKSDIEKLDKEKSNIDEEISEQKCEFINLASKIYKQKLFFTDSLLKSFKESEFDFNTYDTITVSRTTIYLSQQELKNKWRQIIKYRVLYSYFANIDSSNTNKQPTEEELSDLKIRAIDRELCRVKSKLNYSAGIDEYIGLNFLKAIAVAYDPHTNYFTQTEEEEFVQSLSKETISFGFEISKNEYGEIEIYQIIPGSSSWNSNSLNEGDIILSVKSHGLEKDFDCVDLKEAVSFLSSEKIKDAEFLIKKKSGKEIKVKLSKAEIDVQDNVIRSFLLDGEKDIGYIYLPSFYSKMGDYSMSKGCANDVAKELIKLKDEGIEGLIIDLRDNGGGSMLEAILMSGIFVDYGAISIIHKRDEDPVTLKDMSRGTIYNSPIVILINEYSASSSELFAASMQDLNRAVIVGSNSYGKSTMQEVLPLDAYKYDDLDKYKGNPPAYLKISRGAFYRVNGKSHNIVGVEPDIKLPSIYDEISLTEETGLKLLQIDKKTYYYPLKKLPINVLADSSKLRLENDSSFLVVKKIAEYIKDNQSERSIPLNIELFSNLTREQNQYELPEKPSLFIVKKPDYLSIFSDSDSNDDVIDNNIYEIEHDIYIEEAYNIINDLIKLKTK